MTVKCQKKTGVFILQRVTNLFELTPRFLKAVLCFDLGFELNC